MMNHIPKPPSGSKQFNEYVTGNHDSSVEQYDDIDKYFLQEMQFINVLKEPVNAITFARLLHHRIKLIPGDRNIYALEFYIGGCRCRNSAFILNEQKLVSGNSTLYVLCFSHAFLLNQPVFNQSLIVLGVLENKISHSSILVLQESHNAY
jgi:hypothetical protein